MNSSFEQVLAELGVSAKAMDDAEASVAFLLLEPDADIQIASSAIEGLGVFAKTNFQPGVVIGPARINSTWTAAGRFMNHFDTPNVAARRAGTDLNFIALQAIQPGDELTVDYRQVKQEMLL